MPQKGMSRNAASGLTYVANTPSFLKNFGKAPASPPHSDRFEGQRAESSGRPGREPLPERPTDGKWAKGSDDEGGAAESEDDEWGEVFGGGGDDGPQVVVLKEGRHLTAEDVKRERRSAAGKRSRSPSPGKPKGKEEVKPAKARSKPVVQPIKHSSVKRKLVGQSDETDHNESIQNGAAGGMKVKKKKAKMDKGLLSFQEEDGEK